MKRNISEKIYIIFNLAAQKQYVGKTCNLDQRYSDHVSKLRAGKHENPDLQRDWDRDGEENFIWVDVLLRAGEMRPNLLEDLLIDTLQTIDPMFGYNRMTSRGWSQHARMRDLERKLIRRGRFRLILGVELDDPINPQYLKSVWKGHGKVKAQQPGEAECDADEDLLKDHETEGDPQQDSHVSDDEPHEPKDKPEEPGVEKDEE